MFCQYYYLPDFKRGDCVAYCGNICFINKMYEYISFEYSDSIEIHNNCYFIFSINISIFLNVLIANITSFTI